ncbi:MAG: hypothetical protein K0R39_2127 [Symbiobacteriaceae bacterium]|jgi:uncharacterized protein YggE|nr:hypothetical protein [Symbiobacteriaceae bacterium]
MNFLAGTMPLGAAGGQPPVLTVTGEGSVQVAPDTAVVSLGVTARNQQAAAAFQQVANTLNQVVRALLAAGIPREQIQTSQVSISPAFEDGRQMGFEATATVQVTLRDTSTVAGVIDRAVAAGANNVSGITFEVRDPAAAEAAALAAAVQNAQRQAVVLARSLGIALGPVFRVEAEPAPGPVQPLFARAAVAAEQLPVLPGTLTITRRVRVEFLLGR